MKTSIDRFFEKRKSAEFGKGRDELVTNFCDAVKAYASSYKHEDDSPPQVNGETWWNYLRMMEDGTITDDRFLHLLKPEHDEKS